MEVYVLCVGGKPQDVYNDRTSALSALTEGYKMTSKELGQIARAQEIGLPLHSPLLVVGYERGEGWCKDRSLTRVR